MSFGETIKNFVAPPIDEYDDEMLKKDKEVRQQMILEGEEAAKYTAYEQAKNNSVNLNTNAQMILFEPRSFDEADEIARHLKSIKACVVNLHRLPKEYSQRTTDFLSGVVFALDGQIQIIGKNVILCTPQSIGVAGEINLDSSNEQ